MYPPHGELVGRVSLTLHGHTVEAELLSTGHHCRTYGVRINGCVIGVLGADRAWREVSARVPRMISLRRLAGG